MWGYTRQALLSLSLLLVGAIGGSITDPVDRSPPERIGDELVLRADLHTHSRFGDGVLTPFELVLLGRRHGLDVVAVTEHAQVFPARMAAWFSRLIGGPLVLIGQEVTTHRYHLVGLGLTKKLRWSDPLPDVIDEIHRQGGVAIAAHPTRDYWPAFLSVADRLDGVEVDNPLYQRKLVGSLVPSQQMARFYQRLRRRGARVAPIGSSDYHFFNAMGAAYTLIRARRLTRAAVLEAIRAGRTSVTTSDGRTFALSSSGPVAARRPRAPAYAATGWADQLFRSFGWLGALGLVVFRRRRRVARPAVGRTRTPETAVRAVIPECNTPGPPA